MSMEAVDVKRYVRGDPRKQTLKHDDQQYQDIMTICHSNQGLFGVMAVYTRQGFND